MNNEYLEFLKTKIKSITESGFEINELELNSNLFDFQKFIVKTALKKGKYAIFADCGLGKTLMQLEFANQCNKKTNMPSLILCPLAVSGQTIQEGAKFGIEVNRYDNKSNIQICNYEQIENIDCSKFGCIVLDESSILKNYSGVYRNLIIEKFENTQYKLACTATPSPNDELELGNHAEFLDICTSQDMRAVYFTTDKDLIKGDKYRLKKHSIKAFYSWISKWAVMISNPSDLGFDGSNYKLPNLNFLENKIITDKRNNGKLFNDVSVSATEFNKELKLTLVPRLSEVAKIVNKSKEPFIIWVNQNEEEQYLHKLIPDSKCVNGSDAPTKKESLLLGFANNEFRVLITKKKIASFGMNFQNCRNQVHASLDFSFESLYQAIRRSYRFGQKKEVNIYLITTDTMQNVIENIKEKEEKFLNMQNEMRNAYLESNKLNNETKESFKTDLFTLFLDDCVEGIRENIPDNSIGYSFFSPPFGALYVFSDNDKDMSNVKNNDEFLKHFEFCVKELFRVMKSGRLVSIHMMQSTTLLGRDGYYSIVDFRGDLIRLFQQCGFYFHAENMIRKDPKTAAIRTKNRQLMHGTTKKDSSISRPGLADYILTFRKPGENEIPIVNNIPFDLWCKIAEPIWIEVEEGDTLEYRTGRDNEDERHITATQLKPIEWCYLMWSNEGDTVLSPFSGIGSEGYQAVKMNRKFIGFELKKSYYDISIKNIKVAQEQKKQISLLF